MLIYKEPEANTLQRWVPSLAEVAPVEYEYPAGLRRTLLRWARRSLPVMPRPMPFWMPWRTIDAP